MLVCVSRLQDAVNLVSLFHMVHPDSESAQEAASQQATGTDLLKVRTTLVGIEMSADSLLFFSIFIYLAVFI